MRRGRTTAIALVLVGAGLAVPSAADAAATDVFWLSPHTVSAVVGAQQDVTVTQPGPSQYVALGGSFTAKTHADDGWYMGLQTDGTPFSGRRRRQMIFSIWNATSARPGPGAACGRFGGEGGGLSCRLKYGWVPGRAYRYAIVRLPSAATEWGAYVVDRSTNTRREVGLITAPAANVELADLYSFVEYFAGPGCPPNVSLAAQFANPQLNGNVAQATFGSSTPTGSCNLNAVSPGAGGAGAILGPGAAPDAPAPIGLSAPPGGQPMPNRPPDATASVPRRRLGATTRRLIAIVRRSVRTRGGAPLTLTVDQAATATFSLERTERADGGGTYTRSVAAARRTLSPGANRLRITGRNEHRTRLARGRYKLWIRVSTQTGLSRLAPITLTLRRG